MTSITVKFTQQELELLTSLASDQLFRKEFIDHRMPGFKSSPAELGLAKKLVERLNGMLDKSKGTVAPRKNGAAAE
jgi:hypothetical protein